MVVGHQWSAEFFDIMHLAMLRRKAVEEMTYRKIITLATTSGALHANTNLDSEANRGQREKMIQEMTENMEKSFNDTVARIYGEEVVDEYAIDPEDPFFKAMKIPSWGNPDAPKTESAE